MVVQLKLTFDVTLRDEIPDSSVSFSCIRESALNGLVQIEDGEDAFAAAAIRSKRLPQLDGIARLSTRTGR